MKQNYFNGKSKKWYSKCRSNASKSISYLKHRNGAFTAKKNESRLQPKQHKPVNNMEYEDGSAKEKDSADLQLDNNLDNGQKLKVLLMIHIIFIYICFFQYG